MSGSGLCANRRPMRLMPDCAAEIERDAAITHIRCKIAAEQKRGGDAHCDQGRLIRVLDELANDLDLGLHRDEAGR